MKNNWYVIYTKSSCETSLHDFIVEFNEGGSQPYEAYLPTTSEIKQWSDRKKEKVIPLFKNYLFVKHDDSGFQNIKKMPGFSDYIRFGPYPTVMPEDQIDMIKKALEVDKAVTCKPRSFHRGQRVVICKGPMAGYEGILIKDQENLKVAIEIKYLDQCLHVNVSLNNIVKL